jgi:hypothetical protein
VSDDLVLVPAVQARRALSKRPIRLKMLVPYGAWIGHGALRVLRVKLDDPNALALRQAQDDIAQDEKGVELTIGYESYHPYPAMESRTPI